MPTFEVTAPDGKKYRVDAPEGATQQDAIAYIATTRYGGGTKEKETALEKIPVIGGLLAASADLPLNLISGVAGSIKSATDTLGPNNVASNVLSDISTYAEGLTSAQSREDEKTAAAIRKEAEGKGIWEEVKAAARSFGVNPLDTAANVVGSALPFAAAARFGGPQAMIALGAISGAGTVKGSISDAVYARAREAGVSEEQAKAMADEAQSYGGENLDMIALGAALGALAGGTGLDKQIGRAIAKRAVADVAESAVEQQVARGLGRRVATGIGAEALPEGLQAGQERYAQNLAEQRAGYDTDLMAGVAGQAAFEGLAGGLLGGVFGGLETGRPAAPKPQTEEGAPAGERPDIFAFQQQVTARLGAAAGPDLSDRGTNAVEALGRLVSNSIQIGTPESLTAADELISAEQDKIAAGETGPDIAELLQRPALDQNGNPVVDDKGKPVYEGALEEARRMVDEARKNMQPTETAAPVVEEATSGPSGEPTAPVDEGVGARVPPSGEPTVAGAAAPELGESERGPVGVSEPAAPDVTVSPDAERGPLRPVPKMEIASEPLLKLADRYGQAPLIDSWMKSVLGTQVTSELETAPLLERATTMQAGREKLLVRNRIDPLVDAIGREGVNLGDFDFYQLLDHAAERNREVAKINPAFPEGGSSVTTAQAQEGLKLIEKDGLLPKYKKLQKKVQELVRFNLQEDVKAGLRSQEDMDRLLTIYKSWVPLKGWAVDGDMLTADIDEDAHSPARREEAMRALRAAAPSGSIQENRRAWGRGSMPFSPTANLIHDSERRVRRRILNMARLPILRAWKKDPGAFSGMFNVYSQSNPKKVAKGRDIGGERYEALSMPELMKDHYANPGKYLIVKDNGVPYFIEFANSTEGNALRRMFANMEPKDMEGAMKAAADINNFLKGMATYKNPLYLIFVAPFRDFSAAIATAMYHQNLKGSPAYKKNLAARTFFYGLPFTGTWGTIAKFAFTGRPMNTETGKLLEEFVREGGAALHSRFMNVQDSATAADRAIRRIKGIQNLSLKERGIVMLEGLNKWIDALADMMDMSARFATYRAATDYGIQPADAARLALDSSLNLPRRGEIARGLDIIFPFFGAGVEATRKTKRIFTSKGGAKVIGAMIVYGALESLWNAAHSGDDDDDGKADYLNLDQGAGMRLTRLTMYYGNEPDDYVKVPIDPMVGFFKFLGNRIGDIMAGTATPSEATGGILTGAANVLSPVRIPNASTQSAIVAFTPMLGKPIVENFFNQNAFGSPIYQQSQFENAPPSELGRPATGEGWKWLARTINELGGGSEAVRSEYGLSAQPEIYRHMIESYFGGPYQLAKQIAGLPEAEGAADIPGIKSFKGSGSEYAPQTQYFENSSTVRQIMNRLSKLTPEQRAAQGAKYFVDTDPRIIKAYQMVDKQIDKINKEQRAAVAAAKTEAEKKAVLDRYRAEKNEFYSAFNYVYNTVKKEQ